MKEAKISLHESVQSALKAFDTALNNLQKEYIYFKDISAKATIQLLCDVGFFHQPGKKEGIFKNDNTVTTRGTGELGKDK